MGDPLRHDVGGEPEEQSTEEGGGTPRRPVPDEAVARDGRAEERQADEEIDSSNRAPQRGDRADDDPQERNGDVRRIVGPVRDVDPMAEERVDAVRHGEGGPGDQPRVQLGVLAGLERPGGTRRPRVPVREDGQDEVGRDDEARRQRRQSERTENLRAPGWRRAVSHRSFALLNEYVGHCEAGDRVQSVKRAALCGEGAGHHRCPGAAVVGDVRPHVRRKSSRSSATSAVRSRGVPTGR